MIDEQQQAVDEWEAGAPGIHRHLDRVEDRQAVAAEILKEHAAWMNAHDIEWAAERERIFGKNGLEARVDNTETGLRNLQDAHASTKWWVFGVGAAGAALWAAVKQGILRIGK